MNQQVYWQVNPPKVNVIGVYILWREKAPVVLYVGQGDVLERLQDHDRDHVLNQYGHWYVYWAAVPGDQLGGIEHYLADILQPVVGQRHSNDPHIPVNLPPALGG